MYPYFRCSNTVIRNTALHCPLNISKHALWQVDVGCVCVFVCKDTTTGAAVTLRGLGNFLLHTPQHSAPHAQRTPIASELFPIRLSHFFGQSPSAAAPSAPNQNRRDNTAARNNKKTRVYSRARIIAHARCASAHVRVHLMCITHINLVTADNLCAFIMRASELSGARTLILLHSIHHMRPSE